MLRPIRRWGTLRRALDCRGLEIYICEECQHVWIAGDDPKPRRCPNVDCRALADSPKRDRPGRPLQPQPDPTG